VKRSSESLSSAFTDDLGFVRSSNDQHRHAFVSTPTQRIVRLRSVRDVRVHSDGCSPIVSPIYIVARIDQSVPSKIRAVGFCELSGRFNTLVLFASSFTMLSIYSYYDILLGRSSLSSLIMTVGFALSGLAESLPTDRRRIAGGLRVTAIL
jgi:hypothetical protein